MSEKIDTRPRRVYTGHAWNTARKYGDYATMQSLNDAEFGKQQKKKSRKRKALKR